MKYLVVLLVVGLGLASLVWPLGIVAPSARAGGEAHPDSSSERPLLEERTIQGLGYVEPVSEVRRLVFKVDGVIDRCPVDVGQRVSSGEALMSLANQAEAAALAIAEQDQAAAGAEREQVLAGVDAHQIAAAKSKVKLLDERVRHARKHAERLRTLHKTKSLAEAERDRAETDLLQAEAALEQAQAELSHVQEYVRPVDRAVADAKVAQAEARLTAARAHLDETVLYAPSDGTVLEILRREGEASRDAQGGPVLIFADDSRLRVRAEIDERYVHLLRIGQEAVIYGRGLGDKRFTGRIVLLKRLMGGKTVFSRSATERKDLDFLQVLIDMPEGFRAPLGLQVDVAIEVEGNHGENG
ncbi:MAG TPA: efflux RND transporter periplasmic adaptor subunit [Pirellulales bacterium]|nr:efflux RND transporter periplasmic adaptor subunit [Pirellulales bacterium]